MDLIILGVTLILSAILLGLAYRLHANLNRSGERLVKIISFEAIVFRPTGLMIAFGGLLNVFLNPSWMALCFAFMTTSAGAYFLMLAKGSRNALSQNGVIIVEGMSTIIPWENISKMNVHQQRLFIETNKKFYSIKVYNENMAEIEALLRTKHYIQP